MRWNGSDTEPSGKDGVTGGGEIAENDRWQKKMRTVTETKKNEKQRNKDGDSKLVETMTNPI